MPHPAADWVVDAWYSHYDGLIHLSSHGHELKFDPHSEAEMAKLVRTLKRIAPLPMSPDPNLDWIDPLPIDQPSSHAHAVFTNTARPRGYTGHGGRKEKASARTLSAAETEAALADLLASLPDEPPTEGPSR